MTIHVPFRLPLSGFAECKKVQANFDFLTDQLENLNAGVTAWDAISVGTGGSTTGSITFYNASNSNTLGLRAGATSPSYTLTLPTSAGTAGYVLSTDGTGVLSWVLRATDLDSLTDVAIVTPVLNNVLAYNGSAWVNTTLSNTSAGASSVFFLADDNTTGGNHTLSSFPTASVEETDAVTVTNATGLMDSYITSDPIGGTQIEGGVWEFDLYRFVSATAGTNTIIPQILKRVVGTGTLTITGTGTSRTATISGGTPFVSGDANADMTIAGYLETPTATFQITSFSSSSVVTITTPGGYSNESAVVYAVHKHLFATTTLDISDVGIGSVALENVQTVQQAFTGLTATDKLSARFYGRTTSVTAKTISLLHNGTTHYSHFHSPLTTRHNTLAGLQGGSANEYHHLTSAQHTIATQAASALVAGYVTTGTQTIAGAKTLSGNLYLSGYTASLGLLYVAADGLVTQLGFDTGKVLTSTSGAYAYSSLTGTSNQVIITPTAGVFTFSLPQSIATSSVVRFGQVILKDGTVANPNLVLTAGASPENTGLNGTGSNLSFIVAGALQGAIDNAGGIAMLGEVRGLTSRVTASMAISSGSSGTVTIQASSPSGGTYVLTLPVDDGTPNQVLTTDGSGVLSWTTPSGAGANTTLSNLADTVAINKNLNNFSAGTITASLTGAASLNLLLTGGMLTGDLTLDNNKALILREATGNGTDSVSIKTPAALAAAYTLTLPTTDGNANEVLTTDGSGVLSWTAVTALGGANTALSNLASVAVNTPLLPGTDIVTDFGSTSKRWRYMYASYTILGGPGSPGWLLMYPPTASNGWAEWGAADNPSNTVTTCIIGSQSGTRQYSVPDAGGNADFVMSAGTANIAGAKTFTTQLIGKGTATNDSAAAGYIGEIIESVVTTATSFPTSGNFGDLTSISLTAGDWDVDIIGDLRTNGGSVTEYDIGIGTTAGTDATGIIEGKNASYYLSSIALTVTRLPVTVPTYRVSLSGSATIYYKIYSVYTVATPKIVGRITARRVR